MPEVNEFNRRNIEEFRSNRGRLGGPFEGAPVLLLHTAGARSGDERVHPLMYLADDGRYLLFASAAGVDRNPAWYWNLIANPDAGMEIGDEHLDVNAVELSGAECDEKYADQANGILNTRSTSARRLAPSPWWPSSPSRPKPDDLAQHPRLGSRPGFPSGRRYSGISRIQVKFP